MSEEESFVVLGSSPTPSMEAHSSLNDAVHRSNNFVTAENSFLNISKTSVSEDSWLKSSKHSFVEHGSNVNLLGATAECKSNQSITTDTQHSITNIEDLGSVSNNDKPISITSTSAGPNTIPESLRYKNEVGKMDKNEMKMHMSHKFPSLVGKDSHEEDVQKLERLLSDNKTYKDQISNMNKILEHLVGIIQSGDAKRKNETKKMQDENNETEKDMQSSTKDFKINEQQMQNEYDSLVESAFTDKSAVISNICEQLKKLELQRHEMSSINVSAIDSEQNSQVSVALDAAREKIKNIEQQFSEAIAENDKLKEMNKTYVDEIDCLKANLTAAEELNRQNQSEVAHLKEKDTEHSAMLARYDAEKNTMREEIELFKQQLEIYKSDFETERSARQELEQDRLRVDSTRTKRPSYNIMIIGAEKK